MKLKKMILLTIVALGFVFTAGCAHSRSPSAPPVSVLENQSYVFTDSSGRQVELPANIERIAPSGSMAQMVLFSLCPDKLVGFSSGFDGEQYAYIDEKYKELPIYGNFYANSLNLEALMTTIPQVIIDIGEAKTGIAEDMDSIQERTGIPTIFIEMDLSNISEVYKTLGDITGERTQAQAISDYIDRTLSETEEKIFLIPENKRISVYYAQDDGLSVIVSGTIHSDVIDIAGGINVAVADKSLKGGAAEISVEQLLLWNPDVILFAAESIYDDVENMVEWRDIRAIKNNSFYEIPDAPFNWMGRPASVNRILGIKWLSNLLYPDVFPYDMKKEVGEFYKLFYHCDITDAQLSELLAKSTFKD